MRKKRGSKTIASLVTDDLFLEAQSFRESNNSTVYEKNDSKKRVKYDNLQDVLEVNDSEE